MNMNDIPADFPRDAPLVALAGVQVKIGVRRIDGRYVQGITDEEWAQRYEICVDLVNQLESYCRRKAAERPEWTVDTLLQKVREAIHRKAWVFSEAELDWILARVRERMISSP